MSVAWTYAAFARKMQPGSTPSIMIMQAVARRTGLDGSMLREGESRSGDRHTCEELQNEEAPAELVKDVVPYEPAALKAAFAHIQHVVPPEDPARAQSSLVAGASYHPYTIGSVQNAQT